MAVPTKIQHPLLRRPGTSQARRIADALALQSNSTLIDNRSLVDLLDYIQRYAGQVAFPEYKLDEAGQPYLDTRSWLPFFEKSLPFSLARFAKKDCAHLEKHLSKILTAITQSPDPQNLGVLTDFCFFELICPLDELQKLVLQYDFGLVAYLKNAISASFRDPLQRYILLSNSANVYFRVAKRPFAGFTQEPWNIDDVFSYDSRIEKVPGGRAAAVLWLKDELAQPASQILKAIRSATAEVPEYMDASLQVLQGSHEPHLALFLTFLQLFQFFQGDLNQLTGRHLDFFYQEVLRIKLRGAVPDKAHLVFELAKNLQNIELKKDTDFLDSKDNKNTDIIFTLDDEVTVDQALVKDLKTLFLNPAEPFDPEESSQPVVEGIYIAPAAASSDGKGEPFRDDQSKNWPALGAKKGKFIAPGKDEPENLPFGRMGFVLSSPVLWLNEGTRNVTITLTCDAGGNEAIFSKCFQHYLEAAAKTGGPKFYKISEQTIFKLENLFSPRARAYLQEKLDAKTPLPEADLKDKKVFTETESAFLLNLLEKTTFTNPLTNKEETELDLQEMPFASLIRRFNMLRLHQDPYPIGFDIKGFFATKDPITCEPLLKDEKLIKAVIECLDSEDENSDWFKIAFSGPKGWFAPITLPPKPKAGGYKVPCSSAVVTLSPDSAQKTVTITIEAVLLPAEPKVVFYDENIIKEHFELEHPFPMVKVELNPEIQLACEPESPKEECCLRVCDNPDSAPNSLYQFFRFLVVKDSKIDVTVCGMKNLIVQNEESLQDVNKPIQPFGPRPKVRAEFYVGNKELFYKNWKKFWLYTDWKDKPDDFEKYYKDYLSVEQEGGKHPITDKSFKFDSAVLDTRIWLNDSKAKRHLFENDKHLKDPCKENDPVPPAYLHQFSSDEFHTINYEPLSLTPDPLEPLTVNSDKGFFRMTLRGTSFQHDAYAFVLARKLFQLADKLDPMSVTTVRDLVNQAITLRNQIAAEITQIIGPGGPVYLDVAGANAGEIDALLHKVQNGVTPILAAIGPLLTDTTNLEGALTAIRNILDTGIGPPVRQLLDSLKQVLQDLHDLLTPIDGLGLPNEPYTPTIKAIEMDYHAVAEVKDKDKDKDKDIDLIHLYPFENTSKTEQIDLGPTLFPTFTDEGTLFIGLDKATPGANLQLLFQFAEATADSESPRAEIDWYYLVDNRWQPLRTGFEIVSDATDGMTRSGIVKISLPRDFSNVGNTLMPPPAAGDPLYWLKVSAPQFTAAVAELFGVHAQAALTTYKTLPGSDADRSGTPLGPGAIGKPLLPDFRIKTVQQPYESFGGQASEAGGHFNIRVSEYLRHKGRGVDLFDFEHLVLEAFPMIFKCKCINHTIGLYAHEYRRDLEVSPGFITVAVVPDLNKLKAGEALEPKVPISLLDDIKAFLKERMSPFARLQVKNPRYEKIGVTIKVRFQQGRDENYYSAQLQTDLTHFFSPWYLGDSDKISFGQTVAYSDVIGFVENLDYIDFISALELRDSEGTPRKEIVPLTARSILTGGKMCIDIDRPECVPELPSSAGGQPATSSDFGTLVFPGKNKKVAGYAQATPS
jgi:hypothetical protein